MNVQALHHKNIFPFPSTVFFFFHTGWVYDIKHCAACRHMMAFDIYGHICNHMYDLKINKYIFNTWLNANIWVAFTGQLQITAFLTFLPGLSFNSQQRPRTKYAVITCEQIFSKHNNIGLRDGSALSRLDYSLNPYECKEAKRIQLKPFFVVRSLVPIIVIGPRYAVSQHKSHTPSGVGPHEKPEIRDGLGGSWPLVYSSCDPLDKIRLQF